MRIMYFAAAVALATSTAGFAQSASTAQSGFPSGIQAMPLTSNARIETMMRKFDRFQHRQEAIDADRYYVDRSSPRDRYADASRYAMNRR